MLSSWWLDQLRQAHSGASAWCEGGSWSFDQMLLFWFEQRDKFQRTLLLNSSSHVWHVEALEASIAKPLGQTRPSAWRSTLVPGYPDSSCQLSSSIPCFAPFSPCWTTTCDWKKQSALFKQQSKLDRSGCRLWTDKDFPSLWVCFKDPSHQQSCFGSTSRPFLLINSYSS